MTEFEVPKDGKAYLCWHKEKGHCFVCWTPEYVGTIFQQKAQYHVATMGGCGNYPEESFCDKIIRYMNQSGNWVERK